MAQKTSNHRPGLLDRLLRIERSESHDHIESEVVELQNVSIGSVDAQKASVSRALVRSLTAQDDVAMTLSSALSVDATRTISSVSPPTAARRSKHPPNAPIPARTAAE